MDIAVAKHFKIASAYFREAAINIPPNDSNRTLNTVKYDQPTNHLVGKNESELTETGIGCLTTNGRILSTIRFPKTLKQRTRRL